MKMRSLVLFALFSVTLFSAEAQKIANPWQRVGENSWRKDMGEATLRLTVLGRATYFNVTLPCAEQGETQTYRWMAGEAIGRTDKPCKGDEPTIPAGTWIQEFLPLPSDYDPFRAVQPRRSGVSV